MIKSTDESESAMPLAAPIFLGPWRRRCQWAVTLLILATPFIRIDGRSLLRLDLSELTLEAAGQVFRIDELYLFLLLSLAMVLFFLLATLVLGRLWCGWICPQTTLSDVAEWWGRRLGMQVTHGGIQGSFVSKLLLHGGYLLLALLVGANMVWYFVSPYEFFPALAGGRLGYGLWWFWAVVSASIYLDMALLRRLLCRDFCPYGRLQTTLLDAGTLALRFPPEEAHRCIRCGACVRACPTGIDIRRGYQVECIDCGRCLDACRLVMARQNERDIIRYTFGLNGKGPKALLNPRTVVVAAALIGLATALALTVAYRPTASLKLQRSITAPSRLLPGGELATFFTAYLANRAPSGETFSLSARQDGVALELRGPVRGIGLSAGERRRLDFAVISPPPRTERSGPALFDLRDSRGKTVAHARASLVAPKEMPHE
jgi:cytochrome c oxidase accessory protein FixG